MVINHNMPSLNQHRIMKTNVKNTEDSSRKLSSGYRINEDADDAAGSASQRRCVIRSEDLTVHHPMCRMVSV